MPLYYPRIKIQKKFVKNQYRTWLSLVSNADGEVYLSVSHFVMNTTHQPTEQTNEMPSPEIKSGRGFVREVIEFSLIALLIVVPIRFFVAQPFIVSGASMEPTFDGGEYLIVDQISHYFEEPYRGEVIIFKYPIDQSKFFIKRIIGLPGETISIRGSAITITTADQSETFTLSEPYLETSRVGADFITVVLDEDEYFVLGDNRRASSDSRIWGALPKDLIVGRAFLRLLPPSRIDYLPGEHENLR